MPDNGGPSCLRRADLSLERLGRVRAFVGLLGADRLGEPAVISDGCPAGPFGCRRRRPRGQKGA
jgi:hypothetical protein